MKKVFFTLISASVLMFGANAQYCGGSGASVCSPSGTMTEPGLSPVSDSLPPVVNGTTPQTVIQFKNFDTIAFGGSVLKIQSLKIDTLNNLPSGLCWATNKADNTWGNQEDGCIKINGTVCDQPGQYKLNIVVTAVVGTPPVTMPITTNADAANLKYYVRVINSGDPVVAVDTLQTVPFKNVGYSATKDCTVGIVEQEVAINTLTVAPNPFNNKAVVSFFSSKSGVMTERITNMIGSEVYRNQLNVKTGENNSVIERKNLPAGVYFYTITDGKNITTKRMVISD